MKEIKPVKPMSVELGLQPEADDLIYRLRGGEDAAWRQWHDAVYGRLLFFTHKIIQERHAAHDIVSEAFVSTWKLRETLQTLDDTLALLYVICRRRAYNYLTANGKRRKREVLAAEVPELVEELTYHDALMNEVNRAEIIFALHEAIKLLPERQQAVIQLLLDKKSSVEIGAALSISPSTVRSIREQAISNIRRQLLQQQLLTAFALELLHKLFQLIP